MPETKPIACTLEPDQLAGRLEGEHFVVEVVAPAGADAVLDAFG